MTRVRFNCSCGQFEAEIHEDWAPLGVARFMEMVEKGVLTQARFFRVVTKPRPFVVQFGIPAEPGEAGKWRNSTIQDDPVNESNAEGTITFATSGPNSRTTQMFINLGDNAFLDGQGFSPIGKIVSGMDTVRAIYDGYGEAPDQSRIQARGNMYLEKEFPKLDYIESVEMLDA